MEHLGQLGQRNSFYVDSADGLTEALDQHLVGHLRKASKVSAVIVMLESTPLRAPTLFDRPAPIAIDSACVL